MNRQERVIAAVMHKETDMVPYDIGFTQEELKRLIDYTKKPFCLMPHLEK